MNNDVVKDVDIDYITKVEFFAKWNLILAGIGFIAVLAMSCAGVQACNDSVNDGLCQENAGAVLTGCLQAGKAPEVCEHMYFFAYGHCAGLSAGCGK